MSWDILLQIFLFGIALSMDAFAVSVTDGLVYTDIDKKKSFFIAAVFGLMQAIMPLIGFWLVEAVTVLAGQSAGEGAGILMGKIVCWVAFGLLVAIGGKMLFSSLRDLKKPPEQKQSKSFSVKEVLVMGVATAIDALAIGVSLHAGLSTRLTVWLHAAVIMVCTFLLSLMGLFLGKQIDRLLKGKYEISSIIGGAILILLAVRIILSHYLGI